MIVCTPPQQTFYGKKEFHKVNSNYYWACIKEGTDELINQESDIY